MSIIAQQLPRTRHVGRAESGGSESTFPPQNTTKLPQSPALDALDYQQAKAVHLRRSRSRLEVKDLAAASGLSRTNAGIADALGNDAYTKRKEKVAQRQRELSSGDRSPLRTESFMFPSPQVVYCKARGP
jgi:hypothetical protein